MVRVEACVKNEYNLESDIVKPPKVDIRLVDEATEKKLDDFKKKHGCLKLEVGSGVRPKEGYLHLDKEVGVRKPDIDFSCDFAENNLPSDTFDEVLAIHFLEHVYWMRCPWMMAEFNRILKMGGKLFIEVPDYDVAAKRDHTKAYLFFETLYMNNRGDGDITYEDFTTGFNHASTWNADFLTRLAEGMGFAVTRRPDLEAKSVHRWIGVVHLECTKIGKPMSTGRVNQKIGIFNGDNLWFTKYKEAYGE